MLEIIAFLSLIVVLITVLVLSYLERKDLENRLMAKSLEDCRVNTQKDEPNTPEKLDDTVDIDEAQEEIEKDINGED